MKEYLTYILGGFIAIAMVTITIVLMFSQPEQKELLSQCTTALIAAFTFVVGYFFGSSKGSHDKDKLR